MSPMHCEPEHSVPKLLTCGSLMGNSLICGSPLWLYFDSIFFFFLFFKTGFLCGFGACPGTSSCRPGWPRTHRDLPASASQVLGLKACATTAWQTCIFIFILFYFNFMIYLSFILCALVWRCQVPWNWIFRQLWAAMWVLGIESGSSGRAVSALNRWAISPAPWSCIF